MSRTITLPAALVSEAAERAVKHYWICLRELWDEHNEREQAQEKRGRSSEKSEKWYSWLLFSSNEELYESLTTTLATLDESSMLLDLMQRAKRLKNITDNSVYDSIEIDNDHWIGDWINNDRQV